MALPQTQQLNFLLEASALFSASSPQLAAVLGRKALLVSSVMLLKATKASHWP